MGQRRQFLIHHPKKPKTKPRSINNHIKATTNKGEKICSLMKTDLLGLPVHNIDSLLFLNASTFICVSSFSEMYYDTFFHYIQRINAGFFVIINVSYYGLHRGKRKN